jgi:hypothetical protein
MKSIWATTCQGLTPLSFAFGVGFEKQFQLGDLLIG